LNVTFGEQTDEQMVETPHLSGARRGHINGTSKDELPQQ
jgi:hypothetical protein